MTLRSELEALPRRIQKLPLDERGYPVPWFVGWVDGKPEFRAMDGRKYRRAIKERLCWVCGEPLGVHMAFVAGCMCGINRTSAEPPSHVDCAQWSARNCPFLSRPQMVRREDENINNEALREVSAGFAITRNPGVAMVWITRTYTTYKATAGNQGTLIHMGEPTRVEWFREGRPATRQEVWQSINTGIPNLEAVARLQDGGLEALAKAARDFEKWIPAE